MTKEDLKITLNTTAIITGVFTLMLGFMIYSGQSWIDGVNSHIGSDAMQFVDMERKERERDSRITVLEQQMNFQIQQIIEIKKTLERSDQKLDKLIGLKQ